jgi:heme oxygenase (mycobilin-producing)
MTSEHNHSADSVVTLINAIELPADQVDSFVSGWRERADFMRRQPGFRDYTLHRALLPDNRFQLINVARWASQEAFQSAIADPGFRDQIQALNDNPDLEVTANPGLYRVALHADADGSDDAAQTNR